MMELKILNKTDDMTRPYVICHMVMSIDGKVTGDFLYSKNGAIQVRRRNDV